ncbi:uncharacterized protein [Centroberyx affinis]|uniref:uncharacterized protein isoform X1 n=1 Tax=Centroberyx affinis TaxID=166261 RepID=UPI003A5C1B1B
MDIKDSLVKGGVSIIHQIHEGKHQYDVENVLTFKKANGGKAFVRKGDRLMLINDLNLQDLPPEELANMLAKGNPMLTVHQASRVKEPEQTCPPEDTFHPVSKETTLLRFSLEMRREEDLGDDERRQGEEGEIEGDVCQTENGEKGQKGDLLIVALMKTSITVVTGRGCDEGSPCHNCVGKGCTFNDVVMVAESSVVTLVPRGSGSFKQEKQMDNISIEHAVSQKYLRSFCLQNSPYVSPNPEKITIYYYKSDCRQVPFRGTPVVLNFTDSNCFLKCSKDGERVLLRVETYEKQRLKRISRTDEGALSFIFYMKATKTKQRQFESALCQGWFIHIVNTDAVEMGTKEGEAEDPSFFFIIQK